MGKSRDSSEQSPPKSFPNTTPPVGPDMGNWLLNAATKTEGSLGRVDATLSSLQQQLARIETKLSDVEREIVGHGKWMHTLKVFASVLSALLIWLFVNAVWPWLKTKL